MSQENVEAVRSAFEASASEGSDLLPFFALYSPDMELYVSPSAAESGVWLLVYGSLAHGLLTGAMDEHTTFAPDDWRSQSAVFEGGAFRRNLDAVSALARFAADELSSSVAQLAVAWTLSNPAVQVAIVGARSPRHIEEAVAAAELRLSEPDLEQIERILAGSVAVAGPFPEMDRLSDETRSVFTDANVS